MMCANLMAHKTRNDKMIFYHIYWWLEILKNKVDMLDMFNFFNENWNLCWLEYPGLWTKILIITFLKKRQSNLSYFLNLGLSDVCLDFEPKRVKLTSRAYECVFIGYVINNEAYRFYDLNVKVIIKSNDADFYEVTTPVN